MSLRPAAALLALLAASCREEPQPPPMPPPAVTVAHPVREKVAEWDEYTGRLDAAESVNLYSQVTGYLESIHFKDGSEVKKGDLLFQIDPRPFQAVLDQATAQEERARVQLELARSDFERARKLLEAKAVSAEDFDKRSQAVRESEAALRLATATVDAAKLNLDYTRIRSPINGRIGRRLMDVGNLVIGGPMGATMLAGIVSLDPIYCYIDADELSVLKQQRLNREGKRGSPDDSHLPCEMALADEEGWPHRGLIDFVDNRLDPRTGTIQARATFANPAPPRGQRVLQPGYFARVRVPAGDDVDALLIDEKAVGADQAQKIVYVVDEKNIVQPRPVVAGPVIGGRRVIRTGLTEKDRVIVNGMARVRPGMPVQPLTEEQAKAQALGAPGQPGH